MKKLHVILQKVANGVWEPGFSSFDLEQINLRKAKLKIMAPDNKIMVKHFDVTLDTVSIYKVSFKYSWEIVPNDNPNVPNDSFNQRPKAFTYHDIKAEKYEEIDVTKVVFNKDGDYIRIRHVIYKDMVHVYVSADSLKEAISTVVSMCSNTIPEFVKQDTRKSHTFVEQ